MAHADRQLGPTERRLAARKRNLNAWSDGALEDWRAAKGRERAAAIEAQYPLDADGERVAVLYGKEEDGMPNFTQRNFDRKHGEGKYAETQASMRGGQHRAAEPRSPAYGVRAKVSAEQDINWGTAKPAPAGPAVPDTSVRTGVAYTSEEKAQLAHGLREGFIWASQFTIAFGKKCFGKSLMQAAETEQGLGWLVWAATVADIHNPKLRRALDLFMADARVAAAVQVMQDRDAKRAAKGAK